MNILFRCAQCGRDLPATSFATPVSRIWCRDCRDPVKATLCACGDVWCSGKPRR